MQVHYGEGVAIRIGPEPCVGIQEGVGEASAGEHTGQPLSCVSLIAPSAAWSKSRKATWRTRQRECSANPAWSKTLACVEALCAGTGDLEFGQRRNAAGPHREDEESKPMMRELEKILCGWTVTRRAIS